jgi:DNA repair protein RadC
MFPPTPPTEEALAPAHPPRAFRALEPSILGGHAERSTVELLSLLICDDAEAGSSHRRAVELLGTDGLHGLARAAPEELVRTGRLRPAAAVRLGAALELGRRVAARPWRVGTPFEGARQVFESFSPRLREARRESFLVLSLDVRHRLIAEELVSRGSLVASIVHPREVFRPAIRHAAAAIIVLHNHPSGDPTPSAEDRAVTERLRRCGETLGIPLLDHLIIGADRWVSLLGDRGGDEA